MVLRYIRDRTSVVFLCFCQYKSDFQGDNLFQDQWNLFFNSLYNLLPDTFGHVFEIYSHIIHDHRYNAVFHHGIYRTHISLVKVHG